MTDEDRLKAHIRLLFLELQKQSARARDQDHLLARYKAVLAECIDKYVHDRGDDVFPILIRFTENRRS